jgi:hypothetical protein
LQGYEMAIAQRFDFAHKFLGSAAAEAMRRSGAAVVTAGDLKFAYWLEVHTWRRSAALHVCHIHAVTGSCFASALLTNDAFLCLLQ